MAGNRTALHGRTADVTRIALDATAQPTAAAYRTDAKPLHMAIDPLAGLAKGRGVPNRQFSVRLAKRGALMAGRYAHVKQGTRQRRELTFLRIRPGRLIRDIRRKIDHDPEPKEIFVVLLARALQVHR